jgi:hypothetical protein
VAVKKISISLDSEVFDRARNAAEAEGIALSAWLSRADDVGRLLARSRTSDVVDAAVIVAAIEHNAAVLTADPRISPSSPAPATTQSVCSRSEPGACPNPVPRNTARDGS